MGELTHIGSYLRHISSKLFELFVTRFFSSAEKSCNIYFLVRKIVRLVYMKKEFSEECDPLIKWAMELAAFFLGSQPKSA